MRDWSVKDSNSWKGCSAEAGFAPPKQKEEENFFREAGEEGDVDKTSDLHKNNPEGLHIH